MKRLRKSIQWLLLLSLFVSNMPLIYAEEINQAIKQGQAEEAYKKAVTEASSQTVSSENAIRKVRQVLTPHQNQQKMVEMPFNSPK